MQVNKKFLAFLALGPMIATAQTFDFDMTEKQPVYSDEIGYGYDILPAPAKKKQ